MRISPASVNDLYLPDHSPQTSRLAYPFFVEVDPLCDPIYSHNDTSQVLECNSTMNLELCEYTKNKVSLLVLA